MFMNPTYDYDLIVIGAGIAGMVSAVTANGLGKRVAVIEKNKGGRQLHQHNLHPQQGPDPFKSPPP